MRLKKRRQVYSQFYLFFINTIGGNTLLKIHPIFYKEDCIFLLYISIYQIAALLIFISLLKRTKMAAHSAFFVLLSKGSKKKQVLGPKLKNRRMGI